MTENLKIAIAQLNLTVGDLEGNKSKILEARGKAISSGVELVVFSELCVTGYPPEDLVLKEEFQNAAKDIVDELAEITADGKTAMLISAPWSKGGNLYNAAFLVSDGKIQAEQFKHDLPNYGVFDEKRVFDSGGLPKPIDFNGVKLGIMICEDMLNMKVTDALRDSDILISINASPFEVGKHEKRLKRAGMNIKVIKKPLIYVNQICGQDDLVFDGDSFVLSEKEDLLVRLSRTDEAFEITNWKNENSKWVSEAGTLEKYDNGEEVIYNSMKLGLSDYVEKNGFPGVLIGMSGGIDSALTAAVAVDALGAGKVRLVMMPSKYTSAESVEDAEQCAKNLGVELEHIPIENIVGVYEDELAPSFSGKEEDITEENLQSRIRGTLLMALSNKFGNMVLATGNKSEMSVGYATLYGDMCGGYSVLKDVYKMQVFALARWRNEQGQVIPENIITKAPTAELKENQKDEDSLPPYDTLDDILENIVEQQLSVDDIVKEGKDREVVEKVYKMLNAAEYKRRQSPPGVKISVRPFGRDRRYPITNKFEGN